MKRLLKSAYFFLLFMGMLGSRPLLAQSITSAEDGAGTEVSTSADNPNQFNIEGGTQAGANLFHSFEQLGIEQGQIVNFLSNPGIANILGRVVGGDASVIDGLLQVTGGQSNLFLMNPAGIVFGPNAQFNIPADFTATTANGIQLEESWFRALGSNNYAELVGNPSGFAFTADSPGTILNAGNLAALPDNSIRLIGGTVVNTGTISTPGGDIAIEAVPEAGIVTITPEGSLLSLGVPMETQTEVNGEIAPLSALALPQILSRDDLSSAVGVVVEDGVVRLTQATDSRVIPTDAGVVIASGTLDVSDISAGATGGRIDVLGGQVALVDASLDASGESGGGDIRIGGGYQGNGSIQNADHTYVGTDSVIGADAVVTGDGGRVIVWADGSTRYYGDISAQGGSDAGNGGFIEISGSEALIYRGEIDVSSQRGTFGTLLLDPENITIKDKGEGGGGNDALLTDDSTIQAGGSSGTYTISEDVLEALGNGNTNIILEATNDITIEDLKDNELIFAPGTGSITFTADSDNDGQGSFLMSNAALIRSLCVDPCGVEQNFGTDLDMDGEGIIDEIEANGRDLTIRGATIIAGGLESAHPAFLEEESSTGLLGEELLFSGGDITLEATSGDIVARYIRSQAGLLSGAGGVNGGDITITAREGLFRVTGVIDSLGDNGNGDTNGVVSIQSGGTVNGGTSDVLFGGKIKIEALSSADGFNIGADLIVTDNSAPGQVGLAIDFFPLDGTNFINLELIPQGTGENQFSLAEGESGSRGAILSRNFDGDADSSAHNSNSTGEGNVAVIALKPLLPTDPVTDPIPDPDPESNPDPDPESNPNTDTDTDTEDEDREEEEDICDNDDEDESCQSEETETPAGSFLDVSEVLSE